MTGAPRYSCEGMPKVRPSMCPATTWRLFQRAQELAGVSLSAAIAAALRRYVEVEEGRLPGYDDVVVRVEPGSAANGAVDRPAARRDGADRASERDETYRVNRARAATGSTWRWSPGHSRRRSARGSTRHAQSASRELSHGGRSAGAVPDALRAGRRRRRGCRCTRTSPTCSSRARRTEPRSARSSARTPWSSSRRSLQNYSVGQWISRERERLTSAIERAAGEDTGKTKRGPY